MDWYQLAETKSSVITITALTLEGGWAVKTSNRYY
jgi:hypothetical protein